ncbi:MAG: phosphatase PAP2 family protein [Actinomycetota bacterium]|nr:phosphatase PAP2 family protein [Actinomycetota bacterium]
MNLSNLFRGASVRRRVLATFVGLVAGFLASSVVLVGFVEIVVEDGLMEWSRRLDATVPLWVRSTFPPWLDLPMRAVTALGYYWVVVPLALFFAYLFYRRGLELYAVLLPVSAGGAALLATFLKYLFQRPRPELFESDYTASFYSFPSGHATIAVAFYGTLALLVALRLQGWHRWAVLAAGAALALLLGLSRLYLGVHYPTDILAGYLAATLWTGAVATVVVFWRPDLALSKASGGNDKPR